MRRFLLVALASTVMAACSTNDSTRPTPAGDLASPLRFDASAFLSSADNPYFPLVPGTVWTYEGETEEGLERTVVEVTSDTRVVMGLVCTVVRDQVSLDGELVEDTYDWYRADAEGNVWYFGEDSKEIEDGQVVSTAGSWEAGVDGALPGIVMPAHPRIGLRYEQEDAPGVAEDRAMILSLSQDVSVEAGDYEDCLKTAEWTPLEPGNREFKYYAAGVGLVLETGRGGREPAGLVSFEAP